MEGLNLSRNDSLAASSFSFPSESELAFQQKQNHLMHISFHVHSSILIDNIIF